MLAMALSLGDMIDARYVDYQSLLFQIISAMPWLSAAF